MTTHAPEYNPNDYMSLEKTVDFPMNYVPKSYGYSQPPGTYFDPNAFAAQAMQALIMKNMAQAAKAAQAASNVAGKLGGMSLFGAGASKGSASGGALGMANWVKSGRFDFPYGKDIDFFHNRLCFDRVCRHDSEMTQDLNMEWLRRASPAYDTKSFIKIKPKPVQMLIPKPGLKYSVIPYGDVKNGSSQCSSGVVHLPNGLRLHLSHKSTQDVLGIRPDGTFSTISVSMVPSCVFLMMRQQSIKSFI